MFNRSKYWWYSLHRSAGSIFLSLPSVSQWGGLWVNFNFQLKNMLEIAISQFHTSLANKWSTVSCYCCQNTRIQKQWALEYCETSQKKPLANLTNNSKPMYHLSEWESRLNLDPSVPVLTAISRVPAIWRWDWKTYHRLILDARYVCR